MKDWPASLPRALVHDARASLHNLSLALEMALKHLPASGADRARRYLRLAADETAVLDRLVEQLGLLLRLEAGETLPPDRLLAALEAGLREFAAVSGAEISLVGQMALVIAPPDWAPTLSAAVAPGWPDPDGTGTPGRTLIGPALAVRACRALGGSVSLESARLELEW